MLIATSSMLYRMEDAGEPQPVLAGTRIARVAEGRGLDVIASRDGRVCVLGDTPGEWIPTGLEEPITSLLIRLGSGRFCESGVVHILGHWCWIWRRFWPRLWETRRRDHAQNHVAFDRKTGQRVVPGRLC